MRRDIEILKSLYLPEFEEMYSFAPDLKTSVQQEAFWDYFNTILFDTIEIANFLYSYKVAKAEHLKKNSILTKDDNPLDFIRFEQLKKEYISYLVSDYCNGETNPTIELFLKIQFKPFIEEVTFQKEIKQAIIITEHEKLKRKLSLMDDDAAFEIADNEITSAFQLLEKKNEYEKLKEKMKDLENIEQPATISIAKPTKTILLSFLKYTLAACCIGALVWLIAFMMNGKKVSKYDTFVNKIQDSLTKKIDTLKVLPTVSGKPIFAPIKRTEFNAPLFSEKGLDSKTYIVVDNLEPRILSLKHFLNLCKDDSTLLNCNQANNELSQLIKVNNKYIFDEKYLNIFSSVKHKPLIIKTVDQKYYLVLDGAYYYLLETKEPIKMDKVADTVLIERLKLIIFHHSVDDNLHENK